MIKLEWMRTFKAFCFDFHSDNFLGSASQIVSTYSSNQDNDYQRRRYADGTGKDS